jgi:hypothetical protein
MYVGRPYVRGTAGLSGEERNFNGRLLLRLPKSLHRELALTAEAEGVSLNHFICVVLAVELSWRNRPSEGTESRANFREEEQRRRKNEAVDQMWRDLFR